MVSLVGGPRTLGFSFFPSLLGCRVQYKLRTSSSPDRLRHLLNRAGGDFAAQCSIAGDMEENPLQIAVPKGGAAENALPALECHWDPVPVLRLLDRGRIRRPSWILRPGHVNARANVALLANQKL